MTNQEPSRSWRPTAQDLSELGFVALQAVFYVCGFFIVANAIAYAISEDQWLVAVLELVFLPFTAALWPPLAPDDALAWPFTDPGTLFYAWVLGIAAFALSWVIDAVFS